MFQYFFSRGKRTPHNRRKSQTAIRRRANRPVGIQQLEPRYALSGDTGTPPVISGFVGIEDWGHVWEFKGHVTADDPSNLTITFGGVLTKYHMTTTTNAQGNFDYAKVLLQLVGGTVTAETVDHQGQASNAAETVIRSTVRRLQMDGNNVVPISGSVDDNGVETENFSFGTNSFAYLTAPDDTVISAASVSGGLMQVSLATNGHISVNSLDSSIAINSVTLADNSVANVIAPDGSVLGFTNHSSESVIDFAIGSGSGNLIVAKSGSGAVVIANDSPFVTPVTYELNGGSLAVPGPNGDTFTFSNNGANSDVCFSLLNVSGNTVLTKSGTGTLNIDNVSGVTGALNVNFNDGALQMSAAAGALAVKTPDNNVWTVANAGDPSLLTLETAGSNFNLVKEGTGTLSINAGTQIIGTAPVIYRNVEGNTIFNVDVGTPTSVVAGQTVDAITPVSLFAESGIVTFNCSVELQKVFIANGAKVVLVDSPNSNTVFGGREMFTRILNISNNSGTIYGTPNPTRVYSGTLDLRNNDLFLPYAEGTVTTAINNILDMVRSGSNGFQWNGTGIIRSVLASQPNLFTLGVFDNAALILNGGGWGNGVTDVGTNGSHFIAPVYQTADGPVVVQRNTIIVRSTYSGDVNGDRVVNLDDYQSIDVHVNSSATGYGNGDSNFDGIINLDDYQFTDVGIGNPLANGTAHHSPLSQSVQSSSSAPPTCDLRSINSSSPSSRNVIMGRSTSLLVTSQDGSVWNLSADASGTVVLQFDYDGTHLTITKSCTGRLLVKAGTQVTAPVTFVNAAGNLTLKVDLGTPATVANGQFIEAITPVSLDVQDGTVLFNCAQELQSLNIAGGAVVTLKQTPGHNPSSGNNLFTRSLTIEQGDPTDPYNLHSGTLNINGNSVVVDYGPSISAADRTALMNQLTAMIRSAADFDSSWGGLNWDGTGITSYKIDDSTMYGIAIADNAELLANGAGYGLGQAVNGKALYRGQAISSHAILMRFTYAGDANQDGLVDAADSQYLNANVNGNLGRTGYLWGDYNYDGVVDSNDQAYLDTNSNNPYQVRLN